jgi:hypothetical protein
MVVPLYSFLEGVRPGDPEPLGLRYTGRAPGLPPWAVVPGDGRLRGAFSLFNIRIVS